MEERIFTRGNVMLFLITLAIALATALVCNLCGADRITTVAAAPIGGTLAILVIGWMFRIENMYAPMGLDPGVLGVIVGLIITLVFF